MLVCTAAAFITGGFNSGRHRPFFVFRCVSERFRLCDVLFLSLVCLSFKRVVCRCCCAAFFYRSRLLVSVVLCEELCVVSVSCDTSLVCHQTTLSCCASLLQSFLEVMAINAQLTQ